MDAPVQVKPSLGPDIKTLGAPRTGATPGATVLRGPASCLDSAALSRPLSLNEPRTRPGQHIR